MVARNLVPGVEQQSFTKAETKVRETEIRDTVEKYLPEFVKAVHTNRTNKVDMLVLHQDAFASGYHDDEYLLLGMAVKFAGFFGMTLMIQGKNGETLGKPSV